MTKEYDSAWRELFDKLKPEQKELVRQLPQCPLAQRLALAAMRRASRTITPHVCWHAGPRAFLSFQHAPRPNGPSACQGMLCRT